jgi:hypothetical protein
MSHVLIDYDENSSEDSFTTIDNTILNHGVLLDISTVFDNIKMTLYKFDHTTICNELDIWAYNRKLNDEHVLNIYNEIVKNKSPHLMGTIKVVKDAANNFQVIDGMHRMACLKMYMQNKMKQKINVFLEIYHVESLKDPFVFELFKIANSNMNLTIEDDVDTHLVKIIDALASNPFLKNGIIDKNDGRVNRPRISKKELYEAFKLHFKAQCMKQSVEIIVKRVITLNTIIGSKSNLELFGRKEPSTQHLMMKGKATAYGFYLNLGGKFTPEQWIKMV